MRPIARPTTLALALVVSSAVARAQTLTPPKLLQVNCEYVKYGQGPAHDQHEEKWARAIEGVKGSPTSSLAVKSATGPAATCWLTSATSYEDMGKQDAALSGDAAYARALPALMSTDAQYVSDSRAYIAVLHPELTGGEMPNVLTRRAMMWSEWRIRPGQDALWASAVKAYRAAVERAGVKPDFRVYEVVQGAPSPTFWIFASRTGMAGFDADMADDEKIGKAFTADDQKLFADFFSKAVVSVTTNLWNYSSSQSSLTAEQRATDAFWKRSVAMAKKP